MKFIRDIIGEKRQGSTDAPSSASSDAASYTDEAALMDVKTHTANAVVATPEAHFDTSEDTSKITDEIAAFFAQAEADRFDAVHHKAEVAATEGEAQSDEVQTAGFSEESAAKQDLSQSNFKAQSAPSATPEASTPESAVLAEREQPAATAAVPAPDSSQAHDPAIPAMQQDSQHEATESADASEEHLASGDITAAIDEVLVPDHAPDPLIEETLRAARHKAATEDAAPEGHDTRSPEPPAPKASPAEAFTLSPEFRKIDETEARSTQTAEPTPEPQPAPFAEPEAAIAPSIAVPQPAMGRGEARHGRVKTRLLGFDTSPETGLDPMSRQQQAVTAPYTSFPVGWLIVVEGAGRGAAFTLFNGVSTIGRGEDQIVRLDFGDNAISRENHASIAYDPVGKSFFIGHGGKANLVRRNNRPVLSTEELSSGDSITIGETVLRFVPLCGPEFFWDTAKQDA
jgi:hypothetical protein